jgi:hypothetical protein
LGARAGGARPRVPALARRRGRLAGRSVLRLLAGLRPGTRSLLGLIRGGEGAAAEALRALDVGLDTLRREVEALVGRGSSLHRGHIPFTPRAKKVLELAPRGFGCLRAESAGPRRKPPPVR